MLQDTLQYRKLIRAAPGSALVGIKFFVSLSGMVYPLLVVHNANSGNWKLNVMIPVVMSIICLVLAIIAPFVYDDQKKAYGRK